MKEAEFIGSSLDDLKAMPTEVRAEFGHALFEAQCGLMPDSAKPLKGFGGAGVLELIERHDSDTYRAVYTVKFEECLYVLHCFQKKSKSGKSTPVQDIELIRGRLKRAQEKHREWKKQQKSSQ